jgi:DNA-binding IclR family transcriptional regulator
MAVNTGGAPRVLLAFQPEQEIRRRLDEGRFPRLTPSTETSVINLAARLEKIRERGWELATDDVFVGLSALGVPIRSRQGAVVAALSIGGLTHHLVQDQGPRFLSEVLNCARDIAGILR